MEVRNVNLSGAKAYSRRKRASKAVKKLRKELDGTVDGEYRIESEVNERIWENGAENPPTSLRVQIAEGEDAAVVSLADTEPERREEEPEDESSAEEEEYEEILQGTVQEAKDSIRDMDDPDVERILELERENKDRKTLKEWIESR